MADEIKVGGVVRLKSGGPLMTVEEIIPVDGVTKAWCAWFVGDEKHQEKKTGAFPLTSLNKIR